MKNEESLIEEKTFMFAKRMVKAYQYFSANKKEFVLSKQLLRSGTSIGAMVQEARFAQSKADFINKLSIALKEANETEYWLKLLYKTEYLSQSQYNSMNADIQELIGILVAICRTAKENQ